MAEARLRMPNKAKVYRYWTGPTGDKTFESCGIEIGDFDTCFACGFHLKVERAHIVAVSDGGTNDCENIHLLCPNCHLESENLNEKYYWIWLKNSFLRKFKLSL